MEDDQEILPREIETVLDKIVDLVSVNNKNLQIMLSIYLIALDESVIEENHPEFKFLNNFIYGLYMAKREDLIASLTDMGLDEDSFYQIFDLLLPEDRAPTLPELAMLMKTRFLIDLAEQGIENFEDLLESFKREFRQIIIRSYAIDDSPLPKKLNISLDAEDRTYYEKVKSEESELLEKYDDHEADKKLLEKVRKRIGQKVAEACTDADPKFHERLLDLEQQRTDQVLASFADNVFSTGREFSNLKWDILPDEIVDKFLSTDLLRPMLKLG